MKVNQMKSVLKLLFVCLFLLSETNAFAQSTICAGAAVPLGYAVINTLTNYATCGDLGSVAPSQNNEWEISPASGSSMLICAGTPIPSGWQQVGAASTNQSICWPQNSCGDCVAPSNNVVTIQPVAPPPPPPPTCALSVSASEVPFGTTSASTYSLTISGVNLPAGTIAYWYGSEDGATDATGVYAGPVSNTSPLTLSYINDTTGTDGTYIRVAILQAGSTFVCGTNQVTFILDRIPPVKTPGPQQRP